MSIVSAAVDEYNRIWQLRDLRVEDWPMMYSPLPTLLICLTYVFIVKYWGPKMMKDRPAFELRNVLIFYNFGQVLFSCFLFYEAARGGWLTGKYNWICQPVDYSDDPDALRVAACCWWYWFSKFTEFFDTFFFVMRKKTNQISVLHVVHHGVVPFSVWFGVRFVPGGHATFFGMLNSFVHIWMYLYYGIAALGPQYQKFIWWKKHLTTMQMVQFVAFSCHTFQLLFVDCDFPKAFVWLIGIHGVVFFVLFSNFYLKSYTARANKAAVCNNSNSSSSSNDVVCAASATSAAAKVNEIVTMERKKA